MNNQQNNQIQEQDINTRKEHWDNLFLFIDFSRLKTEYPNMWNKEYKLLPLPKTWSETKKKFSEYCQQVKEQVDNLINSYKPYFQANIIPILNKPEGDKTLLFRCKRLLDNKIIGESSSLFLDLVIWEVEWRQVERFKELLRELSLEPMFLTDREDEAFMSDVERMVEGRINFGLGERFFWKWDRLVRKDGQQQEEWEEIGKYLKKWNQGKGANSEWTEDLKRMSEARDKLFDLGSSSVDGLPFLGLGYIRSDSEEGLEIVTQNRRGFNLVNPFVMVVWLHQKLVRVYIVRGYEMIDGKRLYVKIKLEEDWVWRDYPGVMNAKGEFRSISHPVYVKQS